MTPYEIEPGPRFSLLRATGFARGYTHAFVIRGTSREALFTKEAVPREEICRAAGLAGSILHLPRQVHGAAVAEVPRDEDLHGQTKNAPGRAFHDAAAKHEEDLRMPGDARRARESRPAAEVSGDDAGGRLDARRLVHAPEADALVTRRAGHAVGVSTADCLPILLAVPGGACAAVHAGWKGLLAGVIEAAVQQLTAASDKGGPPIEGLRDGGPELRAARHLGSHAEGDPGEDRRPPRRDVIRTAGPDVGRKGARIEACIGPAIGPCCFEVGSEVARLFRERFPEAGECLRPAREPGKAYVDLPGAAALILERAGLDPGAILRTDLCTRCGSDLLESYRRDKDRSGRMIALIGA